MIIIFDKLNNICNLENVGFHARLNNLKLLMCELVLYYTKSVENNYD